MDNAINELLIRLNEFAKARDWEQFHSPKNLSMALSVEVSELMEHFQWVTTEQSEKESLSPETYEEVKQELADIFVYLLRLSDRLSVDLVKAASEKLKVSEGKYPISLSKGNATKYSRRENK